MTWCVNETRYTWATTIVDWLLASDLGDALREISNVRIAYIQPQYRYSLYRGLYYPDNASISIRLWPGGYSSTQLAKKSFVVCLGHELYHHLEHTNRVAASSRKHKKATEFGESLYCRWQKSASGG